jgi:RNA polymerase sigma factor (sigma-70 family)
MAGDYGRAEDITQEVFISALRRMRATERPIAFKPWIYEIAKNACIDNFRRVSRADEVSFDADDGLINMDAVRLGVEGGSTPDAALDAKQQLDHLCGAFGGLSETHHRILVMRELEGLSYREIGERLGMSRPSVESTLFRARRRLSEEYEELVSGRRCLRIQSIIAGAAEGVLGTRDRRRLAHHVAHCQPCRRHASLAGLDTSTLERRRMRHAVGSRIAAFLPLPALVRLKRDPDDPVTALTTAASTQNAAANISTVAASSDSVLSGWGNVVAAAAALVLAGGAAGVGEHVSSRDASPPQPRSAPPVAATNPPQAPTATPAPQTQRQGPASSSGGRRSQGSRVDRSSLRPSQSRSSAPGIRESNGTRSRQPLTQRSPAGKAPAPTQSPVPTATPEPSGGSQQQPSATQAPQQNPRISVPGPVPAAKPPESSVQAGPNENGNIEVRVPLPGADSDGVSIEVPDPVRVVGQVAEPVVDAVRDTVGGVLGILGGGGDEDGGG